MSLSLPSLARAPAEEQAAAAHAEELAMTVQRYNYRIRFVVGKRDQWGQMGSSGLSWILVLLEIRAERGTVLQLNFCIPVEKRCVIS